MYFDLYILGKLNHVVEIKVQLKKRNKILYSLKLE